MKTFIVFAALVAAVSCFSIPTERELHGHWQKFKAEHSKTYKSAIEEAHRMKIFKENAILVAKHNDRYQRGEVTYKVAISKFADLLTHEIIAKRNGYRSGIKQRSSRVHNVTVTNALASPSRTVDWRTKGYVTPIKDQGQCGSCWAFSATGALEAQLFRKTGKLISLSEQNIVDCSRNYGVFGCDGGYSSSAFQYIHDNGGIDTERSYPYEDRNGRCRYSKENNAGTATGYVDIAEGSEAALQDAVARVGPVSVAIDASGWGFQFYDGGIYSDLFCSTDELDHAVLAVGFGSEGNNKDYWIVKNSWGEEWGEKGYIRMTRNKRNQCGIASEATYPTV